MVPLVIIEPGQGSAGCLEERDSAPKDLQQPVGHADVLVEDGGICLGLDPEGAESRVEHTVG